MNKTKNTIMTLSMALAAFVMPAMAFAEEGAAGGAGGPYAAIAAAIAIGLGVFGGAMAQGKAAAAALEGISRNPAAQGKIFTPMLLSLALIESLVLLAFVVAFVKIQL